MTFPTTPILEDFTGVNGTTPPNANWTNDLIGWGGGEGIQIQANTGAGLTGFDDNAYWNTAMTGADVEVYCTLTVDVDDGEEIIILFARFANPGVIANIAGYVLFYYRDDIAGDELTLKRIDAGPAIVPIGPAHVQAVNVGDSLGLQLIGDQIGIWHKPAAGVWTLISTETDATYSTLGYIGAGPGYNAEIDDFGGGLILSTFAELHAAARATYHQSLNLTVLAFKPEIGSYTVRGELFDNNIANKMDSLNIEKHADGGWWAATITLNARLTDAELWFSEGLNLNIEVYNPGLVRIFRGFVNEVELSAGALSATRGPVLDVANRVSVTYAPILDATANPPIYGVETTTTIAEDTDSQAQYGIIEQVFAAEPGRCLQTHAEQQRDTFLEELKDAKTSEDAGFSSNNVTQIVLRVLGYRHRLGTYIHQNTTAATVQLSDKIEQALANDPNALFSTDYTDIEANAFLVNQYENDNRTAEDVIRDLVEIGGAATNNRYVFGIYDDEKAKYNAIPTTALYQHRIADKFRRIEKFGTGELVRPWDVKPGEFLFFPDFLIDRTQPGTDLRNDPRYLFIESVTFSTPYDVQINGTQLSTIPQLLAKARTLE